MPRKQKKGTGKVTTNSSTVPAQVIVECCLRLQWICPKMALRIIPKSETELFSPMITLAARTTLSQTPSQSLAS